jgi:hypothetical protein
MPYITDDKREELISDTASRNPETAGELNYVITTIVDQYLLDHGVSYSTLNEAVGVLECAKQELYRRIVAPYEEQKRFDNGEVYQSAE